MYAQCQCDACDCTIQTNKIVCQSCNNNIHNESDWQTRPHNELDWPVTDYQDRYRG